MVSARRSCWLLTSASIPTPTQTIEVRTIRRVSLSNDSRPQGDYDTQNNNISDLQVTVSLMTLLSHFGTVFASVFISVVLLVLKDHRIVKSGAWYGGRASQCRHHLCIPFASLLGRASAVPQPKLFSASRWTAVHLNYCGYLASHRREHPHRNRPVLGPRPGNVQVGWFVINPMPTGIPKADLNRAMRERFAPKSVI